MRLYDRVNHKLIALGLTWFSHAYKFSYYTDKPAYHISLPGSEVKHFASLINLWQWLRYYEGLQRELGSDVTNSAIKGIPVDYDRVDGIACAMDALEIGGMECENCGKRHRSKSKELPWLCDNCKSKHWQKHGYTDNRNGDNYWYQ